jgi:hypothetical protein
VTILVEERPACSLESRQEIAVVTATADFEIPNHVGRSRITIHVELGAGSARRIVMARDFAEARLRQLLGVS